MRGDTNKSNHSDVIAIFCSDLHASHKAPRFRSEEPNWYDVQKRVLAELRQLQAECEDVPIFFAGDLFHHWNEPAELINFMLRNIPKNEQTPGLFYAIYGQHDMPLHQKKDMHRSAFNTLVEADRILPLKSTEGFFNHGRSFFIYPHPWGEPVHPNFLEKDKSAFHIALCHEYVWTNGFGYFGAPNTSDIRLFTKRLKGFTHAFFGDNHNAFQYKCGGCLVTNCGCMMRRNATERNYSTLVWLLTTTGEVIPHKLQTTSDIYNNKICEKEVTVEVGELVQVFCALNGEKNTTDFQQRVKEVMATEEIDESVRIILEEMMETL